MPSAVFAGEDGRLVAGREADRRARLDPSRFEPNPKRRVDDGSLLLGDAVVPVTAALAAVLGKVAAETSRQLNGAVPDQVRLTHPAQWGAARRNILLSAARQANLGMNIQLVPEPVAAAAHFASVTGRALAPGQAIAVYDLGAGTFDVAVVAAGQQGFTVLAESGLPDLGGLDVDQAMLEHIGRQTSMRDPAGWQRMLLPQSTADRRAARALRDDIRAAKESLSEHPQTEVPMPEPFGDVLVGRAELESLIRPGLLRSVDLLATTCRDAGTSVDRLAGIYLVGGSSRIPLVATLIAERLRVMPVNLDQPETAVALGAHHVDAGGISLRTRDLPPDIPAHLAESRTTAIAPPRPPARPPARPTPIQQQPPPAPIQNFGPPTFGHQPPMWAPTPPAPKAARDQLRVVGAVALFVLAVLSLGSLLTAAISVPVAYIALRLLDKNPKPLNFWFYGYGGVLLAYGTFILLLRMIDSGRGPHLITIGMLVVGALLLLIPLVVRATREGKKPQPAQTWGSQPHPR
jgi:hypothetical protein